MNIVQITIYDIVGYLFPGIFALFGLYLASCPLFAHCESVLVRFTSAKFAALALLAYVLGHCIQGVANWLDRLLAPKTALTRILGPEQDASVAHVRCARRRAATLFGVPVEAIGGQDLYGLMDGYALQHGKTETRDMYIYREGFYRGLAVAFLFIAFGAIIRLLGEHHAAVIGGRAVLSREMLLFLLAASLFATRICYQRFRRFESYRLNHSLYSFLALTTSIRSEP